MRVYIALTKPIRERGTCLNQTGNTSPVIGACSLRQFDGSNSPVNGLFSRAKSVLASPTSSYQDQEVHRDGPQ